MHSKGYITLLLAVLVAILATAGGLSAADYTCAACGKPITKQAVVVDGKLYHPECFRCAACGAQIHGEYRSDDKGLFYHPECFERLNQVICAYCKKPITTGNFVEYKGRRYHQECFYQNVVPRCDICGKPLGDRFITDYWGTRFHPEHVGEFPVCQACGRLVWRGGVELSGGRWLCDVCAKLSVTSPERARGILEEIREELARLGIVVKTVTLRIELVETDVLNRSTDIKGHSHAFAYVHWKHGTLASGDETAAVRVLNGLPEDMLRGIIAHELMHVWQHENGADNLPGDIREGSANWAASLIYSRMQTKRGKFFLDWLEKSPDPVYGQGYRKLVKFADKNGVDGVIRMLKSGGKELR